MKRQFSKYTVTTRFRTKLAVDKRSSSAARVKKQNYFPSDIIYSCFATIQSDEFSIDRNPCKSLGITSVYLEERLVDQERRLLVERRFEQTCTNRFPVERVSKIAREFRPRDDQTRKRTYLSSLSRHVSVRVNVRPSRKPARASLLP